jgi:hypothetical protein
MNLKRAVLFGALVWIIIFFEVSILMFGFKLVSPMYNYMHYILVIFILGFCGMFYFNKKGMKSGFWEGIFAGIVFAIAGIILDAIITVPLFVKSYSFFADPYLWVGIVEGIVIVGIVGALKK